MVSDAVMISAILRRLADAVEKGDRTLITELYSCVGGTANGTANKFDDDQKVRQPRRGESLADTESNDLHVEFLRFETRESLESHILERYQTKTEIVALAKKLRVHTTKADDLNTVINKIIDATLGYRLRQKAIRGE